MRYEIELHDNPMIIKSVRKGRYFLQLCEFILGIC